MVALLGQTTAASAQSLTPATGPRVGIYAGVQAVSVSRDGSMFAVEAEQTVTVYKTFDGIATVKIPHASLPGDDVFSPDSKRILIDLIRNDRIRTEAKIVDTATGKTLTVLKAKPFRGVGSSRMPAGAPECVSFSPNGKLVATSAGNLYHYFVDLYDTESGKRVATLLSDIDGGPRQLLFSPDGRSLVVTHGDNYWVDVSAYSNWPAVPRAASNTKRDDEGLPIFSHVERIFRGFARRFWFDPTDSNKGHMLIDAVVKTVGPDPSMDTKEDNPVKVPTAGDPMYARIFRATGSGPFATLEGGVFVLSDGRGQIIAKAGGQDYGLATCVAFSQDGKICVVGRENGMTDVWKL